MLHNVSHQPENADVPSWEDTQRAYENADEKTKKRMEEEYMSRLDSGYAEPVYPLEELVGLVFVAGKIPKILRGLISAARTAIRFVNSHRQTRRLTSEDKFKLSEHEDGPHGGHAIERHGGKDMQYLKGRKIPKATSYFDEKEAEKITREVMKKNEKEIQKWLNNAEAKQTKKFELEFDKEIGYGVKKNSDVVHYSNKVKVVLEKVGEGKAMVKTSYPEIK